MDGSLVSSASACEGSALFSFLSSPVEGRRDTEGHILSRLCHSQSLLQLRPCDKALSRLLGPCFCFSGCGSPFVQAGLVGSLSLSQPCVPGAYLFGGGNLHFLETGFISFLRPLLPRRPEDAHLSSQPLDAWRNSPIPTKLRLVV